MVNVWYAIKRLKDITPLECHLEQFNRHIDCRTHFEISGSAFLAAPLNCKDSHSVVMAVSVDATSDALK
jgi:hypothetical protein